MELLIARRIRKRREAVQRHQTLARHRTIRDLSNPFSDPNFQKLYRLTPDIALGLIEELRRYYPTSHRVNATPVELKFLTALHFYAQGSYQRPDGRDVIISLSQATVSKALRETTDAFNKLDVMTKWIKFPTSNSEMEQTILKNYRKFNMPGVLGYVDGTHILLKKPAVHEDLYVNRKGQHSLNVQVVCDSNLLILNILARYPGSTHDSFIWRASAVKDRMATISATVPCWLLGDSGYPLEPWLLTPVLNAETNSPEAQYTDLHIRARNCIERCFGVWKARFRCLHKHRTLEYAPTKVGHIVNACAVLHNICIKNSLEEPEVEAPGEISENIDGREAAEGRTDVHLRGLQVRADLIYRLF